MIQVLLVTGGDSWPGGEWTRLDSTEILESPGGSWRTLTTARLPSPRFGLQAGTVDNIVYIFGKCTVSMFCSMSYYFLSGGQEGEQIDEEYPSLNAILSFDKTEESWQPAGQMTVSRYKHAVEVSDHISQYCP